MSALRPRAGQTERVGTDGTCRDKSGQGGVMAIGPVAIAWDHTPVVGADARSRNQSWERTNQNQSRPLTGRTIAKIPSPMKTEIMSLQEQRD